ncbi:MAG: nucleotidyltransferase domain-containing protein [Chitinivibrionia bacterium]|nr:nucleotidyltransferase domain-containing protein [Chitinivibrionia bacterium]
MTRVARRFMQPISQSIKPILEELQLELRRIYKGRFQRLVLYGSYARGEATEDSDIDVMAVIAGVENPVVEVGALAGVVSRISLKYDTLISIYPISNEDFEERKAPLFQNVRKEGISL